MTTFGLFGKLPFRDDFVRVRAPGEPFSSFDDWLVTSVEWAHGHGGGSWKSSFNPVAARAFVYRGPNADPSDPLLVGALRPSQDRAGRLFPLVVAAPCRPTAEQLAAPELLPIVWERIWGSATSLITSDVSGLQAGLEACLVGLDATLASDAEARRVYESWKGTLPVNELWILLYGSNHGEQPERALRFMIEAIRPYRGKERPKTPLSLRLPLGQAAGAAVCFWLDLTRRLAGWHSTIPSFFWFHDGFAGELLLHLGSPPPSTGAELWLPNPDRDDVCNLSVPINANQAEMFAQLPAPLYGTVRSTAPLSELLRAAGR